MSQKIENLWKIYQTVNEWIRFSDTKAGLILATDGVLISVIFSGLKDRLFLINKNRLLSALIILGIISIVLSIYYSVLSLFPNLSPNHFTQKKLINREESKSGYLIFFGDIVEGFSNFKAYKEAVDRKFQHDETIVLQLSRQIFVNSKIADKKFKRVKNSLLYLVVSLVVSAITIPIILTMNLLTM